MTEFQAWSFKLGRWAGVEIRIHYLLVIFAASVLLQATFAESPRLGASLAWLAILLVVLALHELGHAAIAFAQNAPVDDIVLWPLGNLVLPGRPSRSSDNVSIAVAGPAVSGFLAFCSALFLAMTGASMVLNPFGSGQVDSGAPWIALGKNTFQQAPALSAIWFVGWFGYINWVIFLVNLIPALPMDGGRAFRAFQAKSSIGLPRDHFVVLWTARTSAALLTLAGIVRLGQMIFARGKVDYLGDMIFLFSLALLIELVVRSESRMMDDGGFFEDGVFGYDFSEGYTSLEAGQAKVRPVRESALKRWRSRRSEIRRRRRVAREVAEERRMDEILDKLHQHGKASLSDEENRFLVRVSAKFRSRPRARD